MLTRKFICDVFHPNVSFSHFREQVLIANIFEKEHEEITQVQIFQTVSTQANTVVYGLP